MTGFVTPSDVILCVLLTGFLVQTMGSMNWIIICCIVGVSGKGLSGESCLIYTGWGKSRFTIVSMQNTVYAYYPLLIIVLFICITIVCQLLPTPIL